MTTTAQQPPVQLRQYQNAFITNIRSTLAQSRRIIAAMATGGGKTKCFLSITANALARGTTVLILTESTKIFRQIATEQPSAKHISPRQKYLYVEPGGLYIAMAQTLNNRPAIIDQFRALGNRLLIICDEAHVGTTVGPLEALPDAYLIGFTATPDYRFAKHLPTIYSDCVVGPQPSELVDAGYLAPYYHYEMKAADLSQLKAGKDGDFTERSNEWTFDRATVFGGFEERLRSLPPNEKKIVFCSSIKHCNNVAGQLREMGYSVANVHTANPSATLELHEYSHGDTNICVTVNQLLKGWDHPGTQHIFLLRAFRSLPAFLQCVGRGSRTSPGKTHFTVHDYGGNASRKGVGLWITDRDWATMWLPPSGKKKKEAFAPAKECPQCYLMNAASARVCSECGYTWPVTERELAEGVMVDALVEYNGLRGRMISTLSPTELAAYCRTTGKKNYCARIARTLDTDRHGYLAEYAHSLGYKAGWLHHQAGQPTGFSDFVIL